MGRDWGAVSPSVGLCCGAGTEAVGETVSGEKVGAGIGGGAGNGAGVVGGGSGGGTVDGEEAGIVAGRSVDVFEEGGVGALGLEEEGA